MGSCCWTVSLDASASAEKWWEEEKFSFGLERFIVTPFQTVWIRTRKFVAVISSLEVGYDLLLKIIRS